MSRFTLFLLIVASTLSATDRPNIVFILADDLGIGDTKIYGGDLCLIDTPNIDTLADGGLKFNNAYVNASMCGPTRLAIMTGRYFWRNQQFQRGGAWGFTGLKVNPAERHTLGDMFQQAGYKTSYIGKWHLAL